MELDHVFIFVEPEGADLTFLKSIGLIETYRRKHRGQGTENICFCFDNMFLECLWVSNAAEMRGDAIARTALYERSGWRDRGTCPIGLAWREPAFSIASNIATWPFQPPYLPPGTAIQVAIDSEDPYQPMIFRSPGSEPPIRWAPARRGALQHSAGLGRVSSLTLDWPRRIEPGAALLTLIAETTPGISLARGDGYAISLSIERHGSSTPFQLTLPIGPMPPPNVAHPLPPRQA